MKPKLKVFQNFSAQLLPHEAKYLSGLSEFQDDQKREIFSRVIANTLSRQPKEFDPEIDKRKYHYIKSWIETRLDQRDVDKVGSWVLDFQKHLSLDLLDSKEETQMLDYLKQYKRIGYNFQLLYSMAQEYRYYLLVRLRYDDHLIVEDFLSRYKSAYLKAQKIHQKLYEATGEITHKYSSASKEISHWEKWLLKVFKTSEIDGNNRYKAFVLLAFLYTTTKNARKLQEIFELIDGYFTLGDLYSRRILYNYYSNSVLLYSQLKDYTKAIYFGELALGQSNSDTLMHVNHLVAIYLRVKAHSEALSLLENYKSLYESSQNVHQKITYISNYLRVLDELKQWKKAENIGLYFLSRYEKELFDYRWHHFFTSYLNLLLQSEHYSMILSLEKKYQLRKKEAESRVPNGYIPTISWSVDLAEYMEEQLDASVLISRITESLKGIELSESQKEVLARTSSTLVAALPELKDIFKSHL